MGLKEYQAKRDFRETSEPRGQGKQPRKTKALHFVVQKHAATRLHYDFRLEMEGVLKSWAVPKGFPVKRGDRRLAVEVEDHPIEYGGFEGTIPEGNYGAGTVMLWDKGTYSVFGDDPVAAHQAGKIHFVLAGSKLKGEWTLVRMRHFEGNKPQWLLLKSGTDLPQLSARTDDRSALTGRSMKQIAETQHGKQWQSGRDARRRSATLRNTRKPEPQVDIRGGRQTRTSSIGSLARSPKRDIISSDTRPTATSGDGAKGLSNPIDHFDRLPTRKPVFVEPMKALLVSELPKGRDWLYEVKFDGVRALAIKNQQSIELISRSGKDLGAKYPEVISGLKNLAVKQAVLDGEVVAVDSQGRSSFQLLQSYQTAGQPRPPLFYYIFDLLQMEAKDLTGLPLWQRKEVAKKLIEGLPGNSNIRFSSDIRADSQRLTNEMKARGLEGLLGKKRDSIYEPGRRSGAWVKFKWTNEQEFVIGGYTRPKGARSHFGAILVGYYQDGGLRFAAKVGTGFNEKTLEFLFEKFQKLTQPDCPFLNLPERLSGISAGLSAAEMRRCTWLRPELVCQVRFAEWTRDHHLRQPAFVGLRDDKSPREVVQEAA
jgi:bifunctional non-homologous end joining protein LigD